MSLPVNSLPQLSYASYNFPQTMDPVNLAILALSLPMYAFFCLQAIRLLRSIR